MRPFPFALDNVLKRKAAPLMVQNKRFVVSNQRMYTHVWQPGCLSFPALDPWLCVPAFQRVCPFTQWIYPMVVYGLKVSPKFLGAKPLNDISKPLDAKIVQELNFLFKKIKSYVFSVG
jgi:hypothetical protein